MPQEDPKAEASIPRKLLFTLFLEVPGTILNVGGLLFLLTTATQLVADFDRSSPRVGWIALISVLAFPLGRVMVIASNLLSGHLVMPARKDFFALAAGLEVLSQGLCVTAAAFAFTAIGRITTEEKDNILFPAVISIPLFTAMWLAHLAFKHYRAEALQSP